MHSRTQSLSFETTPCKARRKALSIGISGGLLFALAGASACGGGGGNEIDAAPGPDAPRADARPGGGDADAAPGGIDAMDPDPTPAPIILINEIVTHPLQDWGGGEVPFGGPPGTGRVSSADQYVEFFNAGTTTVDMRGWTLEMRDGSTEFATFSEGSTDYVLYISPGSTLAAVRPGAFVVMGDPPGSMGNDIYIELRDANGRLIDDVEIGGIGRDAEGDGRFDGAPSPDENGFALGIFEEAIGRRVGAPDTNVDQVDFIKMYGSPGAPNHPFEPPDETVPPEVVSLPSDTRFPVNQFLRVGFSEAIAYASLAGNVTVSAGGQERAIGLLTLEERDSVLVVGTVGVLPFDQDVTVTVRGGTNGIKDLAGNALAANRQATVRTEPAPANPGTVLLNELCITARRDWNRSSGGGTPFSGIPGTGTVNSADEWVEFYVRVGGLDLRNYTLEVFNGPTLLHPPLSITRLGAGTTRIFGTGSLAAVQAGDRVILGDPVGTIERSAYIVLRDDAGNLVDTVEVGGNTLDQDRGGDGIENGAPGPGLDGGSTGFSDEVVARIPDASDTGDDVADWSHSSATFGSPNQ